MDGVTLAARGGSTPAADGAPPRDEPLPAQRAPHRRRRRPTGAVVETSPRAGAGRDSGRSRGSARRPSTGFYTAFGELVFDHWRRPSAAEYREVIRAALPRVGLPGDLEGAMDSDEHDEEMRRSHGTGVALVGGEAGTPITSIDGIAFFGPVLNAIPRGDEAVQVFDGARLLAGYPQFFELKRTRTRP